MCLTTSPAIALDTLLSSFGAVIGSGKKKCYRTLINLSLGTLIVDHFEFITEKHFNRDLDKSKKQNKIIRDRKYLRVVSSKIVYTN